MQRANSYTGSTAASRADADHAATTLSRGNTLKKKASLRRGGSLKRSGSRRSMKAGSVRSLALQSSLDEHEMLSPFYCPVPTTGNPTEVLANRFQAWRKILKDLIAYFREIQTHYEHRSKSLLKLSNVLNNTAMPPGFLATGGLDEAHDILRNYNKQAIAEANKARDIEEDVILALTGLRSDLHQKIKEIKNLSGDFKNTVEKETEATRKAVKQLNEILGQADADPASTTGRQDPYLLRLAVDRQVERQIEEENYLHRAYQNIERSGRDLESIVVGEVQKAYNAYAGILKREADAAYSTVDELRTGPIAMPKEEEWRAFVKRDDKFVDPDLPLRSAQFIHYKGRDDLACQEIRAGLLERKSKYLKSYTAGWYVLSPTHLHEFKSADKTQAPVMSLYLPEQKLGSHSTEGGSSNKFIIKGRQTGAMHRGHTWVFRAESHETMMAWYEDIKALTEKTPEERSNFVRGHSRSFSRTSQRSISSDGVVDEDDDEPFAADSAAIRQTPTQDVLPRRPSPGGRFPSDITVNAQRGLQAPLSPASVNSGFLPTGNASYGAAAAAGPASQPQHHGDNNSSSRDAIAAAAGLPGSDMAQYQQQNDIPPLAYGSTARTPIIQASSYAAQVSQEAREDGVNPYTSEPIAGGGGDGWVGDAAGADVGVSRGPGQPSLRSPAPAVATATAASPIALDPAAAARRQPDIFLMSGNLPDAEGSQREVPRSAERQAQGIMTDDATSFPPQTLSSSGLSSDVDGSDYFVSHANGSAAGRGSGTARPASGTVRTDSVPTISHLHIPGEYPRSTPALN
ncbi:PH domain-containing protein [Magnaporthiopsis poae ATCC 64411]|uniref:PH domain-containing protein n=1 Tax=Magnaporthiopsis poae (strain ATCC 64411 / 73-15) TaxID=644358 RepID=A0A0C4DUF0_MAGP6|nr:PH domain-containing protein [Magnaporthiopsis poae ATCC 64411]